MQKNFAQQLYPIKEAYDQTIEPYYSNINYNSSSNDWWVSWGGILQSYLRMYETTHDKAYLNKFIKHSYGIQLRRSSTPADWFPIIGQDQRMLYGGSLLNPMAEFVYIVKSDNNLSNTNLLPGLIPSSLSNPTQTILGYGDYANWLQGRVAQSLDYFISDFWLDDEDVFTNSAFSSFTFGQNSFCSSGVNPCVNCPKWAAINFQAGYAASLFYIGNVDPLYTDYTAKAEHIVTHFKNLVIEYYPNQSYTWFHNENQWHCGNLFREDVTHGSMDIQIPLVAYKLYGNGLYQPSEMNKFAHTFTYNIWDRNNNQGFRNNVYGTNMDCSDDQSLCTGSILIENGPSNFYGPGEVLGWMPLYTFDDFGAEPDDIYTVLITQAVKLLNDDPSAFLPDNYCASTTHNLSGAQSMCGLSEVTKAQWDKECINLTLFNRDVAYNQDFIVKNKLIIAPQQNFNSPSPFSSIPYYTASVTDPFAEPKIFYDNGPKDRFIIEPAKTVNMIAGESIELLPGFIAMEGSNFTASINPSVCTDGRMYTGNSNGGNGNLSSSIPMDASIKTIGQQAKIKNEAPASVTLVNAISISPNPNNGISKITITKNNNAIGVKELKVVDFLGKIIWQTGASTNNVFEVDISNYAQGIYYVHSINEQGEIEVQKLVKQ